MFLAIRGLGASVGY